MLHLPVRLSDQIDVDLMILVIAGQETASQVEVLKQGLRVNGGKKRGETAFLNV